MELRQLGTSDLRIPPVIFGAWAIGGLYWGGSDDKQAIRAIQAGIDAGITAIDTAPIYGFGRSERVVGEAIKGRRNGVIIATKCGQPWDKGEGRFAYRMKDESGREYAVYHTLKPESVIAECEESLVRLGVDVIDLYQCHTWDYATPPDVIMEGMVRLKEQGKIRAIGVSNFSKDLLAGCLAAGPLTSDQPRYNPIDRRIEADILPFCREHRIGVITYSPLERGLLTGKVTMDREFPKGDMRRNSSLFSKKTRRLVLEALETLRPIAEAHGATYGQLVINWVACVPGITAAIVGARTPEQARENAGAFDFVLSDEERALIMTTFEKLSARFPKARFRRFLWKLRRRIRRLRTRR